MPPTVANPQHGYGEPPTMAAARARIHEIARELSSDNRFGGSSGRQPPSYAPPSERYEGETQARIEEGDLAAAHAAYDRHVGNNGAYAEPGRYPDQAAYAQPDAYDAPPSLEAPVHEEPWPSHDPMTELRPSYDEALARHEERYGSDRPNNQDYRSDRPVSKDDNSGKYERRQEPRNDAPSSYNSNSYDAAAYEANYPKSPRMQPSYAPPPSDEYARPDHREEERRPSFRAPPRAQEREEEQRPSYQPPRAAPRDETRAEGTGGRGQRENAWSEPPARDPEIPGPARIPQELRVPDGFVMGVQPIRTPNMGGAGSYPPPHAVIASAAISQQPRSNGYGAPGTMAATPNAMPLNPNMPMGAFGPMTAASMNPMMPVIPQPMPPMAMPGSMMNQMHVRAHTSMRPGNGTAMGSGSRAPQMTEVEEAQQGSKVGRFAWFVFGAAFGIFFAFAATGFGFGKKEEAATFPAPAALPAPTQMPPPVQTQAAPQPPIAQQPVAMQPQQPMMAQQPPTVAQQPVAMQPMVAQQPVAMQPMVAQQQPMAAQQPPQPMMMAAPPATGVQAVAPPPQVVQPVAQLPVQPQQQAAPPRPQRRSPPAPRRPRVAQPASDDDDAPAPKKAAAPVDANDILGAGL